MLERLFDGHDDHRPWLLTVDCETPLQVRIEANSCPTVHPEGFIRPRHQEDQPNALVLDEVLEAVDPIVAGAIGYQQRSAIIRDLDDAGPIAFGRAVKPLLASGGQHEEGRGSDE